MNDTPANAARPSGPVPAEAAPCPICSEAKAAIVDSFRTTDISKLWTHFDVHLTDEMLGPMKDLETIPLFACGGCGFEYFDTTLAGGEAFYAELQRTVENYYPEDCPSFARAVRFAKRRKLRSVLDVGCGSGAFLDKAKAAGLETHGIELNTGAAKVSSGKGHKVVSRLLEDFTDNDPRHDLVTAFEVLEHVTDPRGFFESAAQRVKPGGYLAISVPGRDGLNGFCDINPHQWPPHHVTRWRVQDLERLGEEAGMEIDSIGGDLLLGGTFEHFRKLRNDLVALLGPEGKRSPSRIPCFLVLLYRKLGLKFIAPRLGPGIFAFYRRPVE